MKPFPHFVQSSLLRSVPWCYHAFLGVDPVEGRDRRERMQELFSIRAESVGTLRQVHSASVLPFGVRGGDGIRPRPGEGDALWSGTPGTGVEVQTADCVPILMAHRGFPLAAAVHAGWRGLGAGVIQETVRALCAHFGAGIVDGLVAAAGPCARGCCYEIGEETAETLRGVRGARSHLRRGREPGKWTADLQEIARGALLDAGIREERVDAAGICTICDLRFHSYRREKSLTARQASFIYILGDP